MKIETLKKVKAEGMCACSGGIIGMAILEKFVAKKVPKIREYNLGIAMIIGMLFAIIYDMAVGA